MYYSGTITGNGEKLREDCIRKLVPYFETNGVTAEQVKTFENQEWEAALNAAECLQVHKPSSTTRRIIVSILDPEALGSKMLRKSWLGDNA